LPAEYGLHTAAVVDIQTRSGMYEPGGSVNLYGGSHATLTPSMEYGGTIGQTQFFVTGRLLTDNVGIENPASNNDAIMIRHGKVSSLAMFRRFSMTAHG